MKFLLLINVLFSFSSVACDKEYLQSLSNADKFLVAVEKADFVYFGEVVRLYQLPNTPESFDGYNAYVFQVTELVKGQTSNFMELEASSWCGVTPAEDQEYWPNKVGQKFVVAGHRENDTDYVLAVYPAVQAMADIYRTTESDESQ